MGTLIEYRKMPDGQAVYRLLIYSKAISEIASQAIAMNKPIAAELAEIADPKRH